MDTNDLTVRPATTAEAPLFADWAAKEGWNPGLQDISVFRDSDPKGFLVAESKGLVVATLSVVHFGPSHAFVGFYIVRPDCRGRGYGWRLWQAGMARGAGRQMGLDGVVAQQTAYARCGFRLAWNNARFAGNLPIGAIPLPPGTRLLAYEDRHQALLAGFDRRSFPADRPEFLHRWATAPGHVAVVLEWDDKTALAAGVARPCREGVKIGPLYADDPSAARAVLAGLAERIPNRPLFLDVPMINPAAVALAESLGLQSVFETARMWTGDPPHLDPTTLYGVAGFELG